MLASACILSQTGISDGPGAEDTGGDNAIEDAMFDVRDAQDLPDATTEVDAVNDVQPDTPPPAVREVALARAIGLVAEMGMAERRLVWREGDRLYHCEVAFGLCKGAVVEVVLPAATTLAFFKESLFLFSSNRLYRLVFATGVLQSVGTFPGNIMGIAGYEQELVVLGENATLFFFDPRPVMGDAGLDAAPLDTGVVPNLDAAPNVKGPLTIAYGNSRVVWGGKNGDLVHAYDRVQKTRTTQNPFNSVSWFVGDQASNTILSRLIFFNSRGIGSVSPTVTESLGITDRATGGMVFLPPEKLLWSDFDRPDGAPTTLSLRSCSLSNCAATKKGHLVDFTLPLDESAPRLGLLDGYVYFAGTSKVYSYGPVTP